MKEIFELPPMLNGTAEQQIVQLRDFLLRLVFRLNEEVEDK